MVSVKERIEEIKSVLDGKALLEYNGNLYEYIGNDDDNKLIFQNVNDDRYFTIDYDRLIKDNNYYPSQKTGTYKIYHLRSGEENHYKRFEGLAGQPEPVSISDYELVYEGSLADIDSSDNLNEQLEAIFTKFNLNP